MLKGERMTIEQMLKIQRELDRCRAYSDTECKIEGINYKDGTKGIVFIHVDNRYLQNIGCIDIYDWEAPEVIADKVNEIKDVIAGEALIDE